MKIPKPILFALFIAIVIISCKKNETQNSYDKSFSAWKAYKASVNNSYSYKSTYGSFTGVGIETTITVENGKITNRDFIRYKYDQPANNGIPTKTIITEWHETSADLGSHPEGMQLYTLDDIYDIAKNVWLKADAATNKIYFESKNNGVISTAGYFPNNCQDDCFVGVTISDIEPITVLKI